MNNPTMINKKLAIAIGWREDQIRITPEFGVQVAYKPLESSTEKVWWRGFDYRDPCVIWPISVKYRKWPANYDLLTDEWQVWMPCGPCTGVVRAKTPELAIALAVIEDYEYEKNL